MPYVLEGIVKLEYNLKVDYLPTIHKVLCGHTPCKDYPCIVQMLIPLLPCLVAVETWCCNTYSKTLLAHCCVNTAPHLFSDLSVKAD